ncbi:hypothetical protein A3742_13835 [Oleiphilus sp. HI0071]|uniref:M14 family metallopeptidase n=4 Tax=unclassified Oleiphilus TaxID=2631174 RepID=UPI0007C2CD22|nr:M14 family metallopeptidase [Oleiphilus sp. HI0079]KZY68192.1 hypothetical protein A3737_02410 [Oleiphilus sp. HI0065]KZY79920.1 hypothetical protein A3742_13835 [Oleiphilus sp. HI0071]KZZ06262.1 hypothetical protein A3744_00305 [Oleiphilus sp. HI0073]KZZ42990.1 hypothetical protein A3758_05335 [Oleiphilus sp. HI0118]KZZ49957.1 hypothetical protein A3760_14540 [Oleiphilus sp. HI0122]KZZ77455.1 hypothetical protein A3767_02510 [Oleiphilus sp. HI0133]
MQQKTHQLLSQSIGTRRELLSLHYGRGDIDVKVYMQASLHADEVPPMLVLHHLRTLLNQAEEQGLIAGEIVLVPYANPIGLSQHLARDHLGRFDFTSGENFNRSYPDFYDLIIDDIEPRLSQNEDQNKQVIRGAIKTALSHIPRATELADMRLTLLDLAHDADWVLDMHCDFEALMHMYVDTPYLDQISGLARYLAAETVLFAEGSGGSAFDEVQSGVWYRLRDQYQGKYPIPLAGCGVTLEFRGEADVSHGLAARDAQQIFHWLQSIGVIEGEPSIMPQALYTPTPLAGSDAIKAPVSGVLVFKKRLGDLVSAGDVLAEIVNPNDQTITPITTKAAGKFFARENRRFAIAGMDIGKVAGPDAFREGPLLGA